MRTGEATCWSSLSLSTSCSITSRLYCREASRRYTFFSRPDFRGIDVTTMVH